MAERAEPAQDRRHQPPHQGAVAIGQRLQAGMGGRAVELVVEGTVLVQHAVKYVSRDPPVPRDRALRKVLRIWKVA